MREHVGRAGERDGEEDNEDVRVKRAARDVILSAEASGTQDMERQLKLHSILL